METNMGTNELLMNYQKLAKLTCYRIAGNQLNPADIEDIGQDAITITLNRMTTAPAGKTIVPAGKAQAFFRAVCSRLILQALEKKYKYQLEYDDASIYGDRRHNDTYDLDGLRALELSPALASIAAIVADVGHTDVTYLSRALSIPPSAVKLRLKRLADKLKK